MGLIAGFPFMAGVPVRWRSESFRLFALVVVALALNPASGIAASLHAPPTAYGWQVLGAAAALPTLYRPAGLAVDSRGNVYVADAGNFRVVDIGPNGRLLAHLGEADLRAGPAAPVPPPGQEALGSTSLAVDRGGTVYVADSANRYIRVFSPQHRLVADWFIPDSVGANIVQLAVAVGGSGNILVAIAAQVKCPADCATYYIVQRRSPSGSILNQFQSPIGASGQDANPGIIGHIATAVDPRGNIYITTGGVLDCYKSCPSFQSLVKHAPNGDVLGHWGHEGLDVSFDWPAIASGGGGNLFLADSFNHRIEKRTFGGKVLTRWSLAGINPAVNPGPDGVAVGRNGRVYVADPSAGRILTLSSSGKLLTQWSAGGSSPGRFWFPGSIALDGHGRLWVDDAANSRIQELSASGRPLGQTSCPHAGSAMALDRQGYIYAGQLINHVVYISKFSPSGALLGRWGHFHLGDVPAALAVAENGDIYVLGTFYFPYTPSSTGPPSGSSILKLSATGTQLGLFHLAAEILRLFDFSGCDGTDS